MLLRSGFKSTKIRHNPFRQFCLDSELFYKGLIEKTPFLGAFKILKVKIQMVYSIIGI